jgi:hypothetical protein
MPNIHARSHELAKTFIRERKRKIPVAPHPGQFQLVYVMDAGTEKWKRLEKLASTERKAALSGLDKLTPYSRGLKAVHASTTSLLHDMDIGSARLRDRPDWNLIRQKIEEQIPSTQDRSQVEKLIRDLGDTKASDYIKSAYAPLLERAALIDEMQSSWHTALIAAELANSIAALNVHLLTAAASVSAVDKRNSSSSALLTQKVRAIYDALRSRDLNQLGRRATALFRWSQGTVLKAAIRDAAALSAARQGSPGARALGRCAVASADLIRDLLAAQVLGYRLSSMADIGFGPIEAWFEAASKLAFRSAWHPPAVASIKKLTADSPSFDGQVVTIEGLVSQVQNLHKHRKVYSSCVVTDSSGNSVKLGITHIKIDSGGAGGGCIRSSHWHFFCGRQ